MSNYKFIRFLAPLIICSIIFSSGPWIYSGLLTASDGHAQDSFGTAVAVSGDFVVVGSPHAHVGSNTDQGAAYVFHKSAAGWGSPLTEVAELTSTDGANGAFFGNTVAISDDTIVVGAYGMNSSQGRAYVFVKPPTGWAGTLNQAATLTTLHPTTQGDWFGYSVAVAGDVVLVGATWDSHWNPPGNGAAYIYLKPADGWAGTLTQNATLTASDTTGDFGTSVALSGDTAVVGSSQNKVYVFEKPGGGWADMIQTAELTDPGTVLYYDFFGLAVATNGDTVVVGAPQTTVGGHYQQGEAYVYAKPGAHWTNMPNANAKLLGTFAISYANSCDFGFNAAVDGDTIAVSAATGGINQDGQKGAIYLFQKPVGGWSGTLTSTDMVTYHPTGVKSEDYGLGFAMTGQVLLAGAPGAQVDSNANQGVVYVHTPQVQIHFYLPVIVR